MSGFLRSVLQVLRGSLLAHVIVLAALPVLSRIYDPEAFGHFQALAAFLTVLLIMSSLRLEVAVLTAGHAEVQDVTNCAMWLCVMTGVLSFLAISIWSYAFPTSASRWGVVVFALPLLALIAGWAQVFTYLALREKKYRIAANAKIAQAATAASCGIVLGAWLPSVLGLVIADVVGRLAQNAVFLRQQLAKWTRSFRPPRIATWRVVLQTHRDLWRISLPSAVINALGSVYTPVLMLLVFDATTAGAYAVTERLLLAPVGLIAGASSQVFMSELSDLGRNNPSSRRALLWSVVLAHGRWGFLPAMLIFFAGPYLLPILLGANWSETGGFAQALAPLVFVAFAVGPVNMALTVSGNQIAQLCWDVGRLLAVAAVWILVHARGWSPLLAVWLHSMVNCGCYSVYLILAARNLAMAPRPARGRVV